MRSKDHQPLPHPSTVRRPRVELDEDLVDAAALLEQYAGEIAASLKVRGRWVIATEDEIKMKLRHDQCWRIARRFLRVAGTL